MTVVHFMVASPFAECLGRTEIAACMEVRGLGTGDPDKVTCPECRATVRSVRVTAEREEDQAMAARLERFLVARWPSN